MSNATRQYPDPLSLAPVVQEGVRTYQADVRDQQTMARTLALCLVSVGPAHAEIHVHPEATAAERVCVLEAAHEALHEPAVFDGFWEPAADEGWLLWLGAERA